MNVLLIDFGSTYTKLRAVALEPARILACGQGPPTVASDVSEGLNAALADLESGNRKDNRPFSRNRVTVGAARTYVINGDPSLRLPSSLNFVATAMGSSEISASRRWAREGPCLCPARHGVRACGKREP
jgi:hypothetical protein